MAHVGIRRAMYCPPQGSCGVHRQPALALLLLAVLGAQVHCPRSLGHHLL